VTIQEILADIFKSFTNLFRRNITVKDNEGMYYTSSLFGVSPQFNDYGSDIEKITAIFTNPAMLKVISLQCDLFSLGKVYVYQNEKEVKDDIVLNLMNKPNPMQSGSQFLWDYMLWTMIGTSYSYIDSNIAKEDNKLYFLNPAKMEWPSDFHQNKDKLIFSKASEKNLMETVIKYRYDDGSSLNIPLSKIIINTDLSNGTGNWFKGNSRIDALYKIISNSEAALDAININTRYSGKFLVSGMNDTKDVNKLPMSGNEKEDIESKVNGRKQVHAIKTPVDIKRFVENIGNLKLDEAYRTAYFLIGSMYNIPKDVLEAYLQGSTFENQEKATARHVNYTLQPKGNSFFQSLSSRFGYDLLGKSIIIDWSHLPFMQVFEKDRALTQQTQINTLSTMLKAGIPIDQCNQFLDTKFTINGQANAGTN
jgi:hypothetical protein